MQAEIFISFLIGHFISDYMCQSKEMAIKKGSSNIWCLFHCIIYTIIVWICSYYFVRSNVYCSNLKISLYPLAIFLSHYPIDRWCLGLKWLGMIRGRDFFDESVEYKYHTNIKNLVHLNFATVVYVITDNTMHIVLLWFISIWLAFGGAL